MKVILQPWAGFIGLGGMILLGCSSAHDSTKARTEMTPLERTVMTEPAGAINPDQQIQRALSSLDELFHREDAPLLKREERKGVKWERRAPLNLAAVTPEVAQILNVDSATAARALRKQELKLSDLAVARLIASRTNQSVDQVMNANPERDWGNALRKAGISSSAAIDHLDSVYTDLVFVMLNQTETQRR